MKLNQMSFNNFRGLVDNKIIFDELFNVIYGKNGQGKTSLIEAIYFLGTGKSFRTKKVKELLKYHTNRLIVYGEFCHKLNKVDKLAIDVNEEKKDYYFNKEKQKYVDYIGTLNVVSFIPEDIELIIGSPSIRRNFFNYEISQAKKNYLTSLITFEKILKTRNKLLKEKNHKTDIFQIYHQKFIEEGTNLIFYRREFIKNISILLNLNYRKLFDNKSELKVIYDCCLGKIEKLTKEEIKQQFIIQAEKKLSRELYLGYSLVGPQKDDFIFELNGKLAKSYASQGEKKSIVFALKISEIDMLVKERNEYPIFLMDDISSYFDDLRKQSILTYFQQKKIQCFITATENLPIQGKKIVIEKGRVIINGSN